MLLVATTLPAAHFMTFPVFRELFPGGDQALPQTSILLPLGFRLPAKVAREKHFPCLDRVSDASAHQ